MMAVRRRICTLMLDSLLQQHHTSVPLCSSSPPFSVLFVELERNASNRQKETRQISKVVRYFSTLVK